ncbi:MAG: hypothetical protein CSA32_04880 [Desulfobulbus propionicus]|nr:MAG: hypothetical protein CSA32_04880 [Desulfobulbus propionicus]
MNYPVKSSIITDRPVTFFLVVKTEKIGWFKFILEGYDGLALITTISAEKGIVQLWTTSSSLPVLFSLLADIAPRLNQYRAAPLPSSS